MNFQNHSNIYLVIIPRNYRNDIHICGRCKVEYTSLSLFLKHKDTCKETEIKEVSQFPLNKNMEVDNLIEINTLESLTETIEKDPGQVSPLNSIIKHSQLRQYKIDMLEGPELCISQIPKDIPIGSNPALLQRNQLGIDYKRTLQNDEEDIATLLANQLNSETSNDELNPEVSLQQFETGLSAQQNKEKNDEDNEDYENKRLYRGKMRKLFNCEVEGCRYSTLLKKDIERHSRVHTGERPFKCCLCEKAFNRTDKLLLHQRIHAGDKRYKCTKCDYASVDSGGLIKHLRVHNGERPFKCQLCPYRARDSSQLTVHVRSHTGDSPFICTDTKCKSAFKTNSDLKRHMVVHSQERPHSCAFCPYKSTLKRNLRTHIQSQHPNGERREYKCNLCPTFVLPTSRKLKNHMRKHHAVGEDKSASPDGEPLRGEGNAVEKQETFKKRKRKAKGNIEKIAVGVMKKAYDCKICEASFVCQDSLLTHQRYHSKIGDELRKSESNRGSCEYAGNSAKCKRDEEEEGEKRVESFAGDLGLSEGCVADSSFSDSLRNAEILASLNSSQGVGNVRQYVMIAPEPMQSVYNADEYVLVQN